MERDVLKASPRSVGVLIVGMHRSGTSAVTGALQRFGIDLGHDLLAPGEDNPKGYFEHVRAVGVNEELLDALGRSWLDARPLPELWRESCPARAAVVAVEKLAKSDFAASPLFAVKDPRISLLLPVWELGFARMEVEPRVLLVVRDPREVAASLRRRNNFSALHGELLWLRYTLSAERDSRRLPRAVVTYDQLMDSPVRSMQTVLERLGCVESVFCGGNGLDGFVSEADRHFSQGEGVSSGTEVSALALRLHDLLREAALSGGDIDQPACDDIAERLEACVSGWTGLVDWLFEDGVRQRTAMRGLEVELADVRSQLNAQLQWSNVAVQAQERLYERVASLGSEASAQEALTREALSQRDDLRSELQELSVLEHEAGMLTHENMEMIPKLGTDWVEGGEYEHRAFLGASARWRGRLRDSMGRLHANLAAQVSWSEAAVEQREVLLAELADVRSQLNAQVSWSETAVEQREALQAELADVRSQLKAQIGWSEAAVEQREALLVELADVRSQLSAQISWSEEAVKHKGQLEAALAETRGRLESQMEAVRGARALAAELQAQVSRLSAEVADQSGTIERLGRQRVELEAKTAVLHSSLGEARRELGLQRSELARSAQALATLGERMERMESTWPGWLAKLWIDKVKPR